MILDIEVKNDKLIIKKNEDYFFYFYQYILILKEENLKIKLIGTIKDEKICEFYFPRDLKLYIIQHLENFDLKLEINLKPNFIFSPIVFSKIL